ncbi:MAG TPA: hypothetical protein VJ885_05510, partial [Thermoanaerobaculia bacterium]|nr:hypothetical protein [Thermoanaerobaculia bacterium]
LSFKDPTGETRFSLFAQHGPSDYFIDLASGNYDFRLATYQLSGTGGTLSFWTGNNTTVPSERVRITPTGEVGIGATAPDARMTIRGDTGKQLSFKDPTGETRFSLFAQHGPSDYFIDLASGNYDFRLATYQWAGTGGTLSFWTGNNTTVPSERVRITPTGNVGIGTNAPQALLHVAGDIRVDGNINAKYQDIAEWVPTVESLEPGMVVVVAPQNHVAASTEAYDTRVAGVISPRPGLTLGEEGASKVLVATTGRVKVRVDASNGPIREGDILVSSPIKGTAMKSEPLVLKGRKFHQPGTVIGKALEPLEKGAGEILVLLSMQ